MSRVCNEKFWTETLIYYDHTFKSAFFEHDFPKTTLNFHSNHILYISLPFIECQLCYKSVKGIFGKIQKFDVKNQYPDFVMRLSTFSKKQIVLIDFFSAKIVWNQNSEIRINCVNDSFSKNVDKITRNQDIDFLDKISVFAQKSVSLV